jgi:SAM-dependent methyltransferase
MGRADNPYDQDFYRSQQSGSQAAAKAIVPLVLDHVEGVGSVVDVGCGVATWAAEFRRQGITDVVGMDGNYVDRGSLRIPPGDFVPVDLTGSFSLGRRFDLVVSVEVAEHLPPGNSRAFISQLCDLGDVVLFSAASPGQGGDGHLNEAWPSYWRALFRDHGYGSSDPFRPLLWDDESIPFWYRQNLILFRKGAPDEQVLDMAHPSLVTTLSRPPSVRELPGLIRSGFVTTIRHQRRMMRRGADAG